jgi:hypothetical protein
MEYGTQLNLTPLFNVHPLVPPPLIHSLCTSPLPKIFFFLLTHFYLPLLCPPFFLYCAISLTPLSQHLHLTHPFPSPISPSTYFPLSSSTTLKYSTSCLSPNFPNLSHTSLYPTPPTPYRYCTNSDIPCIHHSSFSPISSAPLAPLSPYFPFFYTQYTPSLSLLPYLLHPSLYLLPYLLYLLNYLFPNSAKIPTSYTPISYLLTPLATPL